MDTSRLNPNAQNLVKQMMGGGESGMSSTNPAMQRSMNMSMGQAIPGGVPDAVGMPPQGQPGIQEPRQQAVQKAMQDPNDRDRRKIISALTSHLDKITPGADSGAVFPS